jgi:hypothetical protein
MTVQNGFTFLFSGTRGKNVEQRDEVGLLITKCGKNSLMEWKPISDRILTARFQAHIKNVTLIQCYAPTEATEKTKKEEYYQQPSDTVRKVRKRDIIMMMGCMNAKIGSDNEGLEHVMGEMNENGELFVNLCASYDLVIGGSLFVHKVTRVSPDHNTKNQIDHIAISRKFRRSLTNVRYRRGVDIGSDHHLVIADFQFKIMAVRKRFETRGGKFSIKNYKKKENTNLNWNQKSASQLSHTLQKWMLNQHGRKLKIAI